MNEETTAIVGEPAAPASEIPPRPDLYALATLLSGRWTLMYGGCDPNWIAKSQQKLHPSSILVKFPGGSGPLAGKTELILALMAALRDMRLAYLNKDTHAPHKFEADALAEAERLLGIAPAKIGVPSNATESKA